MARKKITKNKIGRPSNLAVKLSDLVVGRLYKHFSTGQVFRILKVDPSAGVVQYVAETAYTGRGVAMAAKIGEVRDVSNGHQWVGRLVGYVPEA